MSSPRRPNPMGAFAVVLLLAGVVCAGLYRVVAGTEQHAYSPGATPPTTAHVTAGRTYHLAVPGGVAALQHRHLAPAQLQCDISSDDFGRQVLDLTAEGAGSKATDTIATFLAPYTGPVAVDCAGWGPVFVADADSAAADVSGYLLLGCMAAFLVGGVLALAALRARPRPARDEDEVERAAQFGRWRGPDEEVAGRDGRDVGP